jgi:hypothetical protein
MLSAAAAGAGSEALPVRERPAECWLGLVARLRGEPGDAGVAGSQQPLRALHPPAGQVLHGRPAGEPGEPRRDGTPDRPARAASRAAVHGIPGCSWISLSAAPSCGPASALSQPPPPGGRPVRCGADRFAGHPG